jgi:hypothetical protein
LTRSTADMAGAELVGVAVQAARERLICALAQLLG